MGFLVRLALTGLFAPTGAGNAAETQTGYQDLVNLPEFHTGLTASCTRRCARPRSYVSIIVGIPT